MTSRARVFFPTILTMSALVGCSLTTDLTGLSGGGAVPNQNPNDAGSSSSVDGSSSDARDAQSESGSGFCANAPPNAHCADFDTAANVLDGWTRYRGDNTETSTLDSQVSASPTRSAHVIAEPGDTCRFGQLVREIDGAFTHAELSFDVRVDRDEEDALLAGLEIGTCSVIIAPFGDHPQLNRQDNRQGDNTNQTPISTRAPANAFAHVELVFDLGGGNNPTAKALINGQVAAEFNGLVPGGPSCPATGAVWIGLGPHCTNHAAHAWYDNVLLVVR